MVDIRRDVHQGRNCHQHARPINLCPIIAFACRARFGSESFKVMSSMPRWIRRCLVLPTIADM